MSHPINPAYLAAGKAAADQMMQAAFGRGTPPRANPYEIPGHEGAIGPFPGQYGRPHVYARSVHSGAGNCVCGAGLYDRRHTEAAPGVPIPGRESR